MTTGDVIKQLMELDPTGKAEVIIEGLHGNDYFIDDIYTDHATDPDEDYIVLVPEDRPL